MATFSFFALLRDNPDDESPARRIPVTAALQRDLSAFFAQEADSLLQDNEEVDYDPGYSPSHDEILVLRNFQLPEPLRNLREAQDRVERLSDDNLEDGRVTCILGLKQAPQTGRRDLVFQDFSQRQVIRKNTWRYLLLDGNTFKQSDNTGISIGQRVTAVFRGGDLYFKSEILIRRFLDLDQVFKEATDDEVRSFTQSAVWAPFAPAMAIDFADQNVRRKITSLMKRNVLGAVPSERIEEQARVFGIPLFRTPDQKLQLPTDKRMFKSVVRLLSDDLFKGPVSGESFLTNSKRPYGR
jgi:hypothetical protein